MKTATNYFLAITILLTIAAGIILFGTTFDTFNQKSSVQQQINAAIIPNLNGKSLNFYAGDSVGNITITAKIPESPASINIYHGTYREGDLVNVFPNSSREGGNVTSEADAPDVAKKILQQYGGLPSDAIFGGAHTDYLYRVSPSTGDFTKAEALSTSISWWRMLDGKRIMGDCDVIYLELGDNGEPLRIKKQWRTYTLEGNVSIISVSKAITKLENGEVISPISGNVDDINFYGITLGYYANDNQAAEITLEPVWIFYGNTSSGSYLSLEVYARQFANFTATPTSGKVPLTVAFNDTSDASPSKWSWDFGDGTNSTEQNPVHEYTTAGTYNVSLRAWNDLGSDTMEKPGLITARNPAPPVANFTGAPASGTAPLSVIFNDTSTNALTSWFWTFGDGTNATVQNPAHTYSAPGNYSVSLNVTNDDGTDEITKSDYITVTTPPPTTLTTQPTMTTATTVTTTPTTTRPTPTGTRTPLSTVPVITALTLTGLLTLIRRCKIS